MSSPKQSESAETPSAEPESRDIRWVVARGGEQTLGALLGEIEPTGQALKAGRVFVERARASDPDLELTAGQEVCVYAARSRLRQGATQPAQPERVGATSSGSVAGASSAIATAGAVPVRVLAEHEGLVAAYKPTGISTQADHRGVDDCVQSQLAGLLGVEAESLHALGRLDRLVSGVLVFARDEAARRVATAARAAGQFRRRYVALSLAVPDGAAQGTWNDTIGRGRRPGLCAVGGRGAKDAQSWYSVERRLAEAGPSVLRVEPATGRMHQIRVHASAHGAPLLGDPDYRGARHYTAPDGTVRACTRIALHATLVELTLEKGEVFRVLAPPAPALGSLWEELGGDASDFTVLESAPWLSDAP